ncbi:MAG: NAD-dependent epimerase/dehydratase family protein [Planctomycetota bacterium]
MIPLPTTRRSFLQASLASAAAAAVGSPPSRAPELSILVLGGTSFLGPCVVRAALARGHKVTLFNRGKTNADMFPQLEKLRGDRNAGDLASLQGRVFDAVVDTSGYVPSHVEATAKLFADSAKHYTFVSSISVYSEFGTVAKDIDETGTVAEVGDDVVAKVSTIRESIPHYGAMKARCEQAAEAAMPGGVANVRPGLIVGPDDPTDRFTWWPVRVDRGGKVLAPGDQDARVQTIDVRDLGEWIVHCIDQRVTGVYNAVGFDGPLSMAEFLGACKCATSTSSELVWASEEFLEANGVGAWMEMPLWLPRTGRSYALNDRARAQGLRFRPMADTIRDTLAWAKANPRPFARTGLEPGKEKALLEKLAQAGGGK